eukprot:TRINITY_DN2703_c0_g1_i1.p1 TRINITY_DN2703_c0_g1~~TRINITY_DN2703_c0_g1_i1.p1  ORF type:complete len:413 (-),score=90.29 TRINITY_DN2703_c0_g1_i1:154-1278(-)
MAHGRYDKQTFSGRPPKPGRGLRVRTDDSNREVSTKGKKSSIRNQIRSIERLLRKSLPDKIKNAQEKKLEELRNLANFHARAKLERKMALRYKKVKFFERRKLERRIRRLEKQQRLALEHGGEGSEMQAEEISRQLSQFKEDLQYVRFFPKTEKYVSLFVGGDDPEVVAKRNELREMVKANLAAAAASGVDLEETGSEDDGIMDISEDEFFQAGSSSDDADADDEWTDKSTRDPCSTATGKAISSMSSDETNKMVKNTYSSSDGSRYHHSAVSGFEGGANHGNVRNKRSGETFKRNSSDIKSRSGCGVSLRHGHSSATYNSCYSNYARKETPSVRDPSSSSDVVRKSSSQTGIVSSNSDVPYKPRRKRRPKKKK